MSRWLTLTVASCEDIPMGKTIYFYTKTGPYYELSNFSPFGFCADDTFWPTVEHYFQAQKFGDPDYRERIRTCGPPKQAKVLGQTREIPLRDDWDSVRDEVMLFALRLKFESPKLQSLLLDTGDRDLVESSPYDYYWGSGRDGSGKNRLGELLMQVRSEVRTRLEATKTVESTGTSTAR